MSKLKHNIIKFILLFSVGFETYITIEVLFRGYSFPLMGIIGGLALALPLNVINDKISWDIPIVIQMIIGGVCITLMELLAGEYSLHVLDTKMWDYSNMWMNAFDGLICPLFSLFWCLLSGVGIILADAIDYYVMHENTRPYYRMLNKKILFTLPPRLCK